MIIGNVAFEILQMPDSNLGPLNARAKELSTDWARKLSTMDYGRLVRKSLSLHGQKSTPTPKFLDMAKAYFACHISPNFQISLIYAFIECP